MAYKEIIDQLQSRIADLDNAGAVHIYQRYTRTPEELKEILEDKATGTIRGWFISRTRLTSEQSTSDYNTVVHTFTLHGYLSVSDVDMSEIAFQEMLDGIRGAFCPQDRLSDTCELVRPVQFEIIGHARIGGHLCHYAEGTIEVQEFVNT